VKGGGHGDYHLIVLAPASVQEMADFVELGFDLAFRYRNPVMMLTDGAIGQMMEKVYLKPHKKRATRVPEWATTGKPSSRERNIITSLDLDPYAQEVHVKKLQEKYRVIESNEVRLEEFETADADHLIVAYGTSARVSQKAVELARSAGIRAGLLRPITLYPFPYNRISELAVQMKLILSVEMSLGQMVEDVRLAVSGQTNVKHYGRVGGVITLPEEVVEALKS